MHILSWFDSLQLKENQTTKSEGERKNHSQPTRSGEEQTHIWEGQEKPTEDSKKLSEREKKMKRH